MIVLCANRLYTPREEIQNPLVFIEDGLISSISSRAQREIPRNATVIDLASDGFADAILAPLDPTRAALERLAGANEAAQKSHLSNGEAVQALPLGIHLEGPFLSH